MPRQEYVILRDLSRRRGLGISEREPFASGTPLASADSEPSVEVISPTSNDLNRLVRDSTVVGMAPRVPVELIRPISPSAVPDEAPIKLIRPVSGSAVSGEPIALPSWGLVATKVTSCRNLSGAGVVVAVIDSGINKDHPAFKGLMIEAEDYKDYTGEGYGDSLGHGTHCAGTIFGRDVNGVRIGIARGIERAVIAKVFGVSGSSYTDVITDGILWAQQRGAHLISLSLAVDIPGIVVQKLEEGIPVELAADFALGAYRANLRLFDSVAAMCRHRRIDGHGCLLVAAAGNVSKRPDLRVSAALPASADGFIAVGAVGSEGPPHDRFHVADFSNADPTVSAPGVGIVSAGPEGGLAVLSGTSMAAPHVAGLLALWLEDLFKISKDIDVTEAAMRLVGTASRSGLADKGDPRDVGAGVVVAPDL